MCTPPSPDLLFKYQAMRNKSKTKFLFSLLYETTICEELIVWKNSAIIIIIIIIIIIYLFTAIELSPVGSGYFTCKRNMKLVTTKFKSGGLHEKHLVATWNLGNHLSICL